jgi:hypothetical protein
LTGLAVSHLWLGGDPVVEAITEPVGLSGVITLAAFTLAAFTRAARPVLR